MSRKTSPRDWFIRQSAVGGSSREPVRTSRLLLAALIFLSAIGSPLLADNAFRSTSDGSSSASPNPESGPKALFSGSLEQAAAPENVSTTVRMALLLTVVSLVPSVLAMTTC